jgi:hypothetical protein
MWILGLEAGAALFLLVFIVWWTMFSGREPEQPAKPRRTEQPDAPAKPGGQDAPGA